MVLFPPCIAVIDDDVAVCRALGRLVRSLGMRVETHSSGEGFLQAVEHGWKPDCAIVDVQMAGINGLEVQQQLIERQLAIPLIFVTAHDDWATSQRALAAGACGFLRKPVSAEALREWIDRALTMVAASKTSTAG